MTLNKKTLENAQLARRMHSGGSRKDSYTTGKQTEVPKLQRKRSELNTLRNSGTLGALPPGKGLLGEAERTTLLLGVFTLSLDELSEHGGEEMLSPSGGLGC